MKKFDSPPECELHAALLAGDMSAALRILADGVDVTVRDSREMIGNNQTALHYAVVFDDAALIEQIIECGADIDAQATTGQTALWWACNGGHRNSVKVLLEKGADPNIRSSEGYSPLDRVLASDASIIQLLRSFGASD